MKHVPTTLKTTSVFLAIVLSQSALIGRVDGASVSADAFVGEGNQMFSRGLGFDFSTTPLEVVEADGSSSHDLSEAGGSGVLDFDATAMATASYNTLRASASGTITNTYFDENYNFEANTGVPTAYFSQGNARFSQTLQYGGTANNYISTYILRLTGSISGNGRAAVSIRLTHASQPAQSWFFREVGTFDLMIFSQAYVHGAFPQEFQLSINTLYSFDMFSFQDGSNASGGADFGSTLEVVGIDLRDEMGNLQPQGTITSDSGQEFAIVAVPEPSSVALLVFAITGVGIASYRRKKRSSLQRFA